MRVESCGPLFAESKEGDIFFSTNRLSEPIPSIINPKNNFLVGEENEDNVNSFLKLNKGPSATVIVGHRQHPLPVGFFLTDEEWSLFRQPDFGLDKLNTDTMNHLPNINSPLAFLSACSSDSVQSPEPAQEFMKPRELGEYSGTCSGIDDDNNNDIVSKMYPFPVAAKFELEGSSVNRRGPDEYASATSVQGEVAARKELDDGIVRPLSLSPNSEYYDDEHESNSPFNPGPSSPFQRSAFSNYFHEEEKEINPSLSISWNLGGNSVSILSQIPSVDTIGSHPQPITSISATHGQSHHHHNNQSIPLQPFHNTNQQQFLQQPMRAPVQETWMEEYDQDSEQESYFYFEDWQSQSMFLSSEVDKAKLKWHQQQNNGGNNTFMQSSNTRQEHRRPLLLIPFLENTGNSADDTSTLKTFLSKFDDKVAAIWGGGNCQPQPESQGGMGLGYPSASGFPYSESYLSTCSTPVGSNMYPWASPTPEQNHQGSSRYDIRAMQNQIDQQQLLQASQFQQQCQDFFHSHHGNGGLGGQEPITNSTYASSGKYVTIRRPVASHYYQAAAPGVDPAVITPPITKNPLTNLIRKTFGILSIKDGYNIVKAVDEKIPVEEMENSLTDVSHIDDSAAFKRFIPSHWLFPDKAPVPSDKDDGHNDKDHSELEINTMQAIFGSLDLIDDEDGLEDYNWEVNDLLKSKPRTFYEQHFPIIELLNSWTTHFTPIDIIERVNGYNYSSPPGILQPGHENDPNLPEYYTLFAGAEREYNIFLRPAKTLFPIRFKLCPQPEKSIQTEPTQNLASTGGGGEEAAHHDPFRHLTVFDWTSFGYNNNNNEDYLSVSSGSRTPLEFKTTTVDDDHSNTLQIKTTDWFLNGSELASGGGLESDYGYGIDNGNAAAYGARFPHSDFCCDSGIGIEGSSRAGFYDDLYPEYDGVEFDSVGGMALQPYSTVAVTDNDVDYGQFQSFTYNTWSTSSASGKTGKNSRRRMKGKPCKYFLAEGSCKRGNNCKFSHDLTTCRYWAEGSCLKGDGCPYMHCFLDGNTFGECKERRRAGKRYHLESDNDFPALGAFGDATSINKIPTSSDMPQLSSSALVDGAAGSSAEGSLLMLADPAGSMYDSYGFGFSLHPADRVTYEEYPLPIQEQQQHATATDTVPFLKADSKRSGNGRTTGKSQSGSSWTRQQGSKGSSNNNWISSMISVKEKRKKKKQ